MMSRVDDFHGERKQNDFSFNELDSRLGHQTVRSWVAGLSKTLSKGEREVYMRSEDEMG